MSVLVPCPGCSRHVRSAEQSCPFCSSALPSDLASRAVPATRARMDRFATFTFAAALAIAGGTGVGCSGSTTDERTGQEQESEDELRRRKKKDAAPDVADAGCVAQEDPGAIIAMYGMPPAPRPEPCAVDAGPGPQDDGGIHAMYGLPMPEEDGGGIQPMYGASPPPDAGPDDDGGVQAMYGMPFPGNN